MNHILSSLGLDKELVKKLSKANAPKEGSQVYNIQTDPKNYLYAVDQRRIRRRLNSSDRFIMVRFFEGYKPKTIAKMLGVSEESVRSRLRKKGAFGKTKKPGRPKRDQTRFSKVFDLPFLEYAVSHSSLEETISLDPHQPQSD